MAAEKARWLARLGCLIAAQQEEEEASQSDSEQKVSLSSSSEIKYVRAMHRAQKQSTELLRTLFHAVVNQRNADEGVLLEECLQVPRHCC